MCGVQPTRRAQRARPELVGHRVRRRADAEERGVAVALHVVWRQPLRGAEADEQPERRVRARFDFHRRNLPEFSDDRLEAGRVPLQLRVALVPAQRRRLSTSGKTGAHEAGEGMRRTVYMDTSPRTQWSPICWPLVTRHWLAAMMSGSALQEAVQSAAPAPGRPQLVQPAQPSDGSPQSRQASQKGVPSKLQNMPGGHSPSGHSAPMWRTTCAAAPWTAASAASVRPIIACARRRRSSGGACRAVSGLCAAAAALAGSCGLRPAPGSSTSSSTRPAGMRRKGARSQRRHERTNGRGLLAYVLYVVAEEERVRPRTC